MALWQLLTLGGVVLVSTVSWADVAADVAALRKQPSRQAWDRVVRAGPSALVPLLQAWPKDDPVPGHWLRTAFEQITQQHVGQLPFDDLHAFAVEPMNLGPARRLALAAMEQARPGTTTKMLPLWLNDPEFGPDAVEQAIQAAEKLPDAQAVTALQQLLHHCALYDQTLQLCKRINSLGGSVNPLSHLGVLQRWHVVGPFPVSPDEGLTKSFPPEEKVDLASEFAGKTAPLKWQKLEAEKPEGRVDLSLVGIKPEAGAVAYAVARLHLAKAVTAELRAGAVDNITIWINGQKVVERASSYRSHFRTDRYRASVSLPAGDSTVLVKLTKTRPEEAAAPKAQGGRPAGGPQQKWDFQVRLVDRAGRALAVHEREENP